MGNTGEVQKTKNKTTAIQDQAFRVDLTLHGISHDRAVGVLTDCLPASMVTAEHEGSQTITDSHGRSWLISTVPDSHMGCLVKTPILRYADMGDLLSLADALHRAGARGGEGCGMRLFVSVDGQPQRVLSNLKNLIYSNVDLLAKAFGIRQPYWTELVWKRPNEDGTVEVFPFAVASSLEREELEACILVGLGILAQARNQRFAIEKIVRHGNERYIFRCWMVRMGLVGAAYKPSRLRLMRRLEGDSAGRRPASEAKGSGQVGTIKIAHMCHQ